MRVLFWSGPFWPQIGGVEVLAARLLPALRERGYEFVVVTGRDLTDFSEEEQFKGIPVHRFPFWTALVEKNPDQVLAIRRQITELKRSFAPHLVHVNSFGPGVLFHLDTLGACPAPLLVTLHGDAYKQVVERNSLLEKTLRQAALVTGCSAAAIEHYRQALREIVFRSLVIYNGMEAPPLAPEPLPFDPPRLLCVGRLAPEKRFDLVLIALAVIRKRFPHVRLIIAGDGPTRAELERQTAHLGLTGVVEFVGWIAPEKVPALINTATAIIMSSRKEGLPLVALEAALMARPVVATRVGGMPEVVVHQQTGLLVESENSTGLAAAIAYLLDHSEIATRMGQSGRKRAQEIFSWKRCVDSYDGVYRKLIANASHDHTQSAE
ncbi:MAG TPA: glycosyltransferase family 4 protein [Candidatus Binatia bacterium]|jgi:glycogen(starch) synthase